MHFIFLILVLLLDAVLLHKWHTRKLNSKDHRRPGNYLDLSMNHINQIDTGRNLIEFFSCKHEREIIKHHFCGWLIQFWHSANAGRKSFILFPCWLFPWCVLSWECSRQQRTRSSPCDTRVKPIFPSGKLVYVWSAYAPNIDISKYTKHIFFLQNRCCQLWQICDSTINCEFHSRNWILRGLFQLPVSALLL